MEDENNAAATRFVNSFFSWSQDEIGASQLGGAPLLATQGTQEDYATPVPDPRTRPTRQVVPPDPLTYSQRQTRAAQRANRTKRGRI